METKNDISYGVIPLFKVGNEWQVLVIHQISHRGDRFWIFPKGHAEAGETSIEASLRELAEETGLQQVTLKTDQVFSVQYSFTHEEVRINKQVDYYVGVCSNQDTNITQPEEVMELRWCTFSEAEALVSHQNSKDILHKVEAHISAL
jgi:8-oxo-dGTP pyrophosphatase MutT (NUDIX family)